MPMTKDMFLTCISTYVSIKTMKAAIVEEVFHAVCMFLAAITHFISYKQIKQLA